MIGLFVATVFVLWPGIVEYVSSRTVHMHWSRLIVGTFTLFSMLQTAVFAILMKVILIWQRERSFGAVTDAMPVPPAYDIGHTASVPPHIEPASRS
jgi:hypothetical protein